MYLIPFGEDHALLAWVSPEQQGLRLIGREGTESTRDIGGRTGSLKVDNHGQLILRQESGAVIIDADRGFEVTKLHSPQCGCSKPRWSVSFLRLLVDSVSRCFAPFSINREALDLADPGYTEPTDATLLPNGREVAVTIARSEHIALVDVESGHTRLVNLAGRYGNANAIVEQGALWVVNYDTLCRIDLNTLEVRSSPVLQAPFREPQHGVMTSAFVGVPTMSRLFDAWLVPRPYSGDVLLVSKNTLAPVGHIPCGGRPLALVEFADGSLLILEHSFKTYVTASIDNLVEL